MAATLQVAVTDWLIILIYSNQENSTIRRLFHILRRAGLLRAPDRDLGGTIIQTTHLMNGRMEQFRQRF